MFKVQRLLINNNWQTIQSCTSEKSALMRARSLTGNDRIRIIDKNGSVVMIF